MVRKSSSKDRLAFTDKLDKVLTNTILGPVIMLAVVYFMFWTTFIVGAYPQGWVEDFFGWLGEMMTGVLPEGLVQSLVVDDDGRCVRHLDCNRIFTRRRGRRAQLRAAHSHHVPHRVVS